MNIFSKIAAGDSATWNDNPFRDTQGKSYDSLQYALKYEIRGAQVLTLNAAAFGPGWQTSITTAQSTTLGAGLFAWAAYATKAGERVTVGTGMLTITPDLAAAVAGYDGRSQDEKDLAAIDAEISARASGGFSLEYTIGNRSLKKEPISALLVLRDRLVRRVASGREAESIANGLGNPRRVMVRF